MAELQQILERRRSSADLHVVQALGCRKSKQEQENLAFRSGWSSTPDCAGSWNSFDIFTPRISAEKFTPRSDDNNRQGAPENENTSDIEVEVDIMKSGDAQLQRALEAALAERDAALLDAATVRGELTKAHEEISQLRESLRRMSSSTDVLLSALHEQQLELSKQEAIEEDQSPFTTAALEVFDLLDLDKDGQLSPIDVQVFAELMTPPKESQGPDVLCQKIWQQLGMKEQEKMGRSEWLQLIRAKAGSALGRPLSVVDLERLVSSLEALEAAGMRRF